MARIPARGDDLGRQDDRGRYDGPAGTGWFTDMSYGPEGGSAGTDRVSGHDPRRDPWPEMRTRGARAGDERTRDEDRYAAGARAAHAGAEHGPGEWGNQGYGVAPHLAVGGPRRDEGEWQARGNRGPKGWTRSDARIGEDVCERLAGEPGLDPSDVSVDVSGGVVVLTGTVTNRAAKHRIEMLAASRPGVADVDNRIRVRPLPTGEDAGTARRGGLLGRLFGYARGSRIADVMTRNPQVVRPDESVADAARAMRTLDVGALPVCDGRVLVGMITDRDIAIRVVAAGGAPDTTRVSEAMTAEVHWCFESDDVEDVLDRMGDLQVRRIPVVDRDRRLVGIVALGDLAERDPQQVRDALDEISERR